MCVTMNRALSCEIYIGWHFSSTLFSFLIVSSGHFSTWITRLHCWLHIWNRIMCHNVILTIPHIHSSSPDREPQLTMTSITYQNVWGADKRHLVKKQACINFVQTVSTSLNALCKYIILSNMALDCECVCVCLISATSDGDMPSASLFRHAMQSAICWFSHPHSFTEMQLPVSKAKHQANGTRPEG